MSLKQRTGGQIVVDQLAIHGVDHIFCVPGESYLAVLDALHDATIDVTVCRQEGGAAMMAEAYGKLTGRPGICLVTRGPGATNASPGLHIARQDSTPMILFVGQIDTGMREREAFQELDYRAAFGSIAKWATEIDDPARLPELISRAFHVATSGRPGPVVIALPEDMLTACASVPDAPAYEAVETHPGPTQMAELQKLLWGAQRPLAILGGSRWSEAAVRRFSRFAERFALPVVCSFRRQMLISADHPSYAGDLGLGANPKLLRRVADADLVLLVGGRMSEIPSQSYTLFEIPVPRQKLVHIHPDPGELGRVYRADFAINASPTAFCAALEGLQPPNEIGWRALTEAARADYLAWSDPSAIRHPGSLQLGAVMAHLRKVLPADTIFCNGAGNFATWVHRFWPHRAYGTQLAPIAGSMGYGLPAAVGRETDPAGPDRRGLRRGRRFPDERAGIRHGSAIRPADCRRASRQRHVRHDPDAPGARHYPGPRLGDEPEEPGLRRLCPRLRRAWRAGRADGGFRARRSNAHAPRASPRSCIA